MSTVPLRAYNSEIEKLTETGNTQEAIAHCKHILNSFPKHIDTYRLLGKAFLESQRYGEAADILQRVLSVIPDDFISQIGMSLIREDEGNLDAAIYHMERAFEVQPSNPVIQDELRRLYGRRDGVEPPKIRLTRGALVRMYARGELYPQAIAEIRATLAEDPQRIDLQIILARLYYLSGPKAQSAEICSKLVSQLPYCYEANRILAEVLPGADRSEDARIYQDRLNALDPYMAFISGNQVNSSEIPDNAVMVEHLEYQPGQEEVAQPEWTKSVGVKWEEPSEEIKPDWMSEEIESSQPAADAIQDEQEIQPAQPADMPDWMTAAGWSVASSDASEPLPPPVNETAAEDSLPLAPGDIPEWLRDLAPGIATPGSGETIEQTSPEDEVWLQQILGTEAEEPTALINEQAPPEDESSGGSEPEMMAQTQSSDADILLPGDTLSEKFNDILSESQTPVELESDFAEATQPGTQEEDLPDWLKPMGGQEPDAIIAAKADLPDWMKDLDSSENEAATTEIQTQPDTVKPADRVEPSSASAPQFETNAGFVPEDDIDSAMAWLEALAAKQGADEATLLTQPDQRSETAPDWIQKEQANLAETNPPSETNSFDASASNSNQLAAAEGLPNEQLEPLPVQVQAEPVEPAQLTENLPEWLNGFGQEKNPEENAVAPESEYDEPIESAATVQAEIETAPAIESALSETPLAIEPPSSTDFSAADDMDSAFAWLEALAAKQGADEATLLVHPEDRREEPPSWVQENLTIPLENTGISGEMLHTSPAEVLPILEEPEPIKSIEIPAGEWIPEESTNASETQSVGINAAPEIVSEPSLEIEASSPSETEASEEITSEWIPEQALELAPEKAAEGVDPDQLPEWLQDLSNYSKADGISPDTTSNLEAEPLPEWLKGIDETEEDLPDLTLSTHPSSNEPEWMIENQAFEREQHFKPEEEISIQPESPETDTMAAAVMVAEDTSDNLPEPAVSDVTLPEIEKTPFAQPTPASSEVQTEPAAVEETGEKLNLGQQALARGNVEIALGYYDQLIQSGECLDDTIHDLRDALYRFPVDINIWQSLGDAYSRCNRIQDALDAYTKAEELLR